MRAEELIGGKRYLYVRQQRKGEPHVRASVIELHNPLKFITDNQLVLAKTVRHHAFVDRNEPLSPNYGEYWIGNVVWPVELEERDEDDSDVLRLRDGP